LEQSGDRVGAIDSYRKAVETAWPRERSERSFWREPVTLEAVERLKDLLDQRSDAKEITALMDKARGLSRSRTVTPLAIPLTAIEGLPLDRE
jgi:hypothetical protein